MEKISLKEKFSMFNDQWSPKVIGDLNGQQVKLAKLEGDFVWHQHQDEDELFLVIKGCLKIAFRDKEVLLNEGEMIIVPRGVEHKPMAEHDVWVLLFEPASTKHTGNVVNERTVHFLDRI